MRANLSVKQKARVTVRDQKGQISTGSVEVHQLSSKEAFVRGARRSGRIIGIVALVLLPLAVLEPFLFMLWGGGAGLILLLGVGPYLHFHYWTETASFERVEAPCPSCQSRGGLRPYVSTKVEPVFSALCASCGEQVRVELAG